MGYLVSFIHWMQSYSKAAPIMAGLIGLWITGIITFVFVKVPKHVWGYLRRQFTTSLSINNSTLGGNLENFNALMTWFRNSPYVRFSRTFYFDPSWDGAEHQVLGPGGGSHYFIYKRRIFRLLRNRLENTGAGYSSNVCYEITITMLGRKQSVLVDLLEDFRYRPPKGKIGIYHATGEGWDRVADAPYRPLETVVVKKAIKDAIVQEIEVFLKDRDWHISRGIPYKRVILLRGGPGGGKTSLIKAIASHFDRNLALINLTSETDRTLGYMLSKLPKKSIVAMEDFDDSAAVQGRDGLTVAEASEMRDDATGTKDKSPLTPAKPKPKGRSIQEEAAKVGWGLTLGGLLNTLDGLLPLDGAIIFMTTNKVETIDQALIREARVDSIYELGPLEDEEIREYIRVVFPEIREEDLEHVAVAGFKPIMGCKLYSLFERNRYDATAFIKSIPRNDITLTCTAKETTAHVQPA